MQFEYQIPAIEFIENIPKAYYILDSAAKIVYANQAACDKVGYTKEELCQMGLADLDATTHDISHWKEFIKSSLKDKNSLELRSLHKTKSKVVLPVIISVQMLNIDNQNYVGGFVDYIDEICELNQEDFSALLHADLTSASTEIKKLREQKQRLDLMMNTAPIAISVIDINMEYKAANKFLLDLLGVSESVFLGSKVGSIDQNTLFFEYVKQLFASNDEIYQKELELSPNGQKKWFHLVGAILPNRLEAVIVGIDISEEKRKDELLVMQSRQAAMGEMIGHIAHQWRHPIASIGQMVENISLSFECGKLDATYLDEKLSRINNQIRYMSNTIDDFKNFFNPSKYKSTFCVCELVKKSLDLMQAMLIDKNIKTKIELQEDVSCATYGHPNEFSQVVINIIQNAKDALLSQMVFSPLITIKVYSENDCIITTIEDNAGGIPDDIMPKIFNPYFSTKDASIGTGIGLYMSKVIIEKNMGGELKVENIGKGALFTIILKGKAPDED